MNQPFARIPIWQFGALKTNDSDYLYTVIIRIYL